VHGLVYICILSVDCFIYDEVAERRKNETSEQLVALQLADKLVPVFHTIEILNDHSHYFVKHTNQIVSVKQNTSVHLVLGICKKQLCLYRRLLKFANYVVRLDVELVPFVVAFSEPIFFVE
jgi:hypothetical protein